LDRLLSTLALVAALATPAGAQVAPSSPQEIASAVGDCLGAAELGGISETRLTGAGWAKASISREGKPLASELGIYGKGSGNTIIMVDGDAKKPGTACFVMAKLSAPKDYQAVVDGIDAIDGVSAVQQDKLKIVFASSKHIVQSDYTGSKGNPAVRVAIMAMSPEK
jgi:hypothetical protein